MAATDRRWIFNGGTSAAKCRGNNHGRAPLLTIHSDLPFISVITSVKRNNKEILRGTLGLSTKQQKTRNILLLLLFPWDEQTTQFPWSEDIEFHSVIPLRVSLDRRLLLHSWISASSLILWIGFDSRTAKDSRNWKLLNIFFKFNKLLRNPLNKNELEKQPTKNSGESLLPSNHFLNPSDASLQQSGNEENPFHHLQENSNCGWGGV